MNAILCDACMRLEKLKTHDVYQTDGGVSHALIEIRVSGEIGAYEILHYPSGVYQICEECSQALLVWLKGRRKPL